MIPLYEFHSHTDYTDGRDSMETMIKTACDRGLKGFGISEHLFCDNPDWGFKGAELDAYLDELELAKEKYRGRMEILTGLEVEDSEALDYITPAQLARTDYLIRSCHSTFYNGEWVGIDSGDSGYIIDTVEKVFGGSWYEMVRAYYDTQSKINPKMNYSFIAHFDLITKFNQDDRFFRTDCDEYLEPAIAALDELLHADIPFEINSGAMSRGHRKEPYPQIPFLKEICQRKGRILVSSDAHRAEHICYNYYESIRLAYDCGFRKMTVLTLQGPKEIDL
ncbi:MAG: histidinol-phosphatase HisJ family protein [Lachnospiraceae bacterium]|nr:histidinol-phosphatase HisJ family protein [Lachnospiraceae bacterium]